TDQHSLLHFQHLPMCAGKMAMSAARILRLHRSGAQTVLITSRQPSSRSVGRVFGPRVEGDGGGRSNTADRVDDGLKQHKTLWRQANTGTDHYAGIVRCSQMALHGLHRPLIGADQAKSAFPTP